MAYFVAPGKALTTKRGVVASDSDDPCITAKCLVGPSEDPAAIATAEVRLAELCESGYLVKADDVEGAKVEVAKTESVEAEAAEAARTKIADEAKATFEGKGKGKGKGKGATRASSPDPLGGNAGG